MLVSDCRPRLWRVTVSIALAACLTTIPADWLSQPVVASVASDGCITTAQVQASTCRLVDGVPTSGTVDGAVPTATYRVDALTADTTLDLTLAPSGSARVSVYDWRATELAAATGGDDGDAVHLTVQLPLPGAYAVTVAAGSLPVGAAFSLSAALTSPTPAGQAIWPLGLALDDAFLTGERHVIRTPRGGTSIGGVAVARALGAPPTGMVGDFVLVSDVQFEKIVGPSALSVRFRFEPEAGGGTGYLFSIDPYRGTASLDSFEEGQRRPIVAHRPLPSMPTSEGPNRLVLRAEGPSISATLDGTPILVATDSQYIYGLIAVGVVTWSEPVAVTFDHLHVTTTP